ncbi:MAG: AMP-binding protein [Candidatus Thiodiazotropha sp. (ex Monitilora ramsayi)]|nr:AMP-binding protein [Candidatus Thiodiazotropha sp. (ex Monitilora ramsayi)]
MNIANLMQDQALRQPEVIAIIDTHRGAERMHNYAVLASDAARTAALLREKGIGKGDCVLVFQPMSYELYVALLAIFRLGAVAMFLDPSAGRVHINQCCDIGAPKALIASTRAHLLRFVSASLRRIPVKFVIGRFAPGATSMRQAAAFVPLETIEMCEPEDPALLTFTSGSTGLPKAALRSHAFLMAQHRVLDRALRLKIGEVDLTTLPVFLLANLASGLTSVIPQADLRFPGRIDPAPVVEQIERYGVTRSAGSPAFYQRLTEFCEAEGRHLEGVGRIDTGGAPVFPGLLRQLQSIAPEAQVVSVYGSTEAEPMSHISWREMDESDLDAMRSGKGLLAGPPVSEVNLRVLRDRFGVPIGPYASDELDAETLPIGEIGEVVVTGGHVLKGYLHGRGELETKFEVDRERWHRTGDAGYMDADGRLWLVGRCSARIEDEKGVLYPFSVECAAHFLEGVRRSAMVSSEGRRILLLESDKPLDSDAIIKKLDWVQLDELREVKRIPVDKRHNAKVDYTRVYALLDKSA